MSLFNFDKNIHDQGITYLCGIDEAGRGPLAGPVVAAAVILPGGTDLPGVNDSKKLSAEERRLFDGEIKKKAITWAVGWADEREIEQKNILQATFLAMRRAVEGLTLRPDYLLVDGRDFPDFYYLSDPDRIPGRALVGGDRKSLCIAAASIVAKVYRDNLMQRAAEQFPQYGFERHKGYGTALHRQMILKYGPCSLHRKSFIKKIVSSHGSLNDAAGWSGRLKLN